MILTGLTQSTDKSLDLSLQLSSAYMGFCRSNTCSPTLSGFVFHSRPLALIEYAHLARIKETEEAYLLRILTPGWTAVEEIALVNEFSGFPDHRGYHPPGGGGGGKSGGGGGNGGGAAGSGATLDIPTPVPPCPSQAPTPEQELEGFVEYIPIVTPTGDIS